MNEDPQEARNKSDKNENSKSGFIESVNVQ